MKNIILLYGFWMSFLTVGSTQINTTDCLHDGIAQMGFRSSPTALTLLDVFTSPYAIEVGESFKIALKIADNSVSSIELRNFSNNLNAPFRYKGLPFTSLLLIDDGTQGDEKMNDKIFTIDQITVTGVAVDFPDSRFIRNADVKITRANGTSETIVIDLAFGIRTIPVNALLPIIKKINDTVQYSNYVFNLVTSGYGNAQQLSKVYYTYLPDDRDFLMRATTFATPGNNPAGSFATVNHNKIKGIRSKTSSNLDNSLFYGSNGKLMGFMNFFYTHGPYPSLFVHEILHYWCAFTDKSLSLDEGLGHWATVEWPSSGFGSTNWVTKITKITDSTFDVGGGPRPIYYNQMELYLMGLLPADSIPFPIKYLKNPGATLNITADGKRTVKGEGIQFVTKEIYFAAMDLRSPGPATSQKLFKIGLMVTSNRLLTPKEMAYFEILSKDIESTNQSNRPPDAFNFFAATRGKARIDAKIANLSTSVQRLTNPEIKYFPNPASKIISFTGLKEGIIKYSIYTIYGQLTESGKLINNKFDCGQLASGVYTVVLSGRDMNKTSLKICVVK